MDFNHPVYYATQTKHHLIFTNHVLLFTSNVHNGPSLNVVTGQKQSSDTTAVKSDLSGITGNGQYIQDI